MKIDDISDLSCRGGERAEMYADIEARAVELLKGGVAGTISLDELDSGLLCLQRAMAEAEKGEVVVDEHYPMWLAQLFAYSYRDWHLWRVLFRMHREHPEQFADPKERADYREIERMNYDERFIESCRYYIEKNEKKN